jgi:hypothetical protein
MSFSPGPLLRSITGIWFSGAKDDDGKGSSMEGIPDALRDLLEEVLCHELAHVAVYRLHGRAVRPHGPEWKGLVAAAGFKPRARFERAEGRFPTRGGTGRRA